MNWPLRGTRDVGLRDWLVEIGRAIAERRARRLAGTLTQKALGLPWHAANLPPWHDKKHPWQSPWHDSCRGMPWHESCHRNRPIVSRRVVASWFRGDGRAYVCIGITAYLAWPHGDAHTRNDCLGGFVNSSSTAPNCEYVVKGLALPPEHLHHVYINDNTYDLEAADHRKTRRQRKAAGTSDRMSCGGYYC